MYFDHPAISGDGYSVRCFHRALNVGCTYTGLDAKSSFQVALHARQTRDPALVIQVVFCESDNAPWTEVARYAGYYPDKTGATRTPNVPF